ncbi:hypothetical protein ACKKBG_A36405 [Auxenochlorella protothecoides x Auxenochlorella symbiontica]
MTFHKSWRSSSVQEYRPARGGPSNRARNSRSFKDPRPPFSAFALHASMRLDRPEATRHASRAPFLQVSPVSPLVDQLHLSWASPRHRF